MKTSIPRDFELYKDTFNSAGHLMLARHADGTCNDAKWQESISSVIMVGYPDLKEKFDAFADLEDLPVIDPDEMSISPAPAILAAAAIVADPVNGILAAPAVVGVPAYPGRRRFPLGADNYMTVEVMDKFHLA